MKYLVILFEMILAFSSVVPYGFAFSAIDVKNNTPKNNPCDKKALPDDIYADFRAALGKFLNGSAVAAIDKQLSDDTKTKKQIPIEVYTDDLDGFKKQYKDDRDGLDKNKTAKELEQEAENIYNSHPAYTYTTDKTKNGVQVIKVKFFCQDDLRIRTLDNNATSGWKLFEQMLHEFLHVKLYGYDVVGAKPPFVDHDDNSDNDSEEEFFKRLKKYLEDYKSTLAIAPLQATENEFASGTVTEDELGVKRVGALPGSRTYFLKEWARGIKRLFAFNAAAKAKVELGIASEKAAELKTIAEKSDKAPDALAKALKNYQESHERLLRNIEKLKKRPGDPNVDQLLKTFTDRSVTHTRILEGVRSSLPHFSPEEKMIFEEKQIPKIIDKVIRDLDLSFEADKGVSYAESELNFKVEIDGVIVGSFKEVDDLESAMEVVEYTEDGKISHKRPGKTNYSNITLKRGLMKSAIFLEWYKKVVKGVTERKSISIVILNDKGQPQRKYNYFEAWPCKWNVGMIDGRSALDAVEEITICVERLQKAPQISPSMPKSEACNIQCFRYDPVCGVDGKTYGCGNTEAACNGVKVAYPGECKIEKPISTEQKPIEGCFCTQQYDPVCGSNGKTYGNACTAKCSGVGVSYGGECRSVQPPPTSCLCTKEYAPVCGTDGKTYGNSCEAKCAGAGEIHIGECYQRQLCPAISPPYCPGGTIIDGGVGADGCRLPPKCVTLQQTKSVCPLVLEPVCGSDNKTYGNSCSAKQAGVGVLYVGECKVTLPPPPPTTSTEKVCPAYPVPTCAEGYKATIYTTTDGCMAYKCEQVVFPPPPPAEKDISTQELQTSPPPEYRTY